MKIKTFNDDILIYIQNGLIDMDMFNDEDIEYYIKGIILKIKKKRIKDMSGSYIVNVYQNDKYGLIIDMHHESDIDFFPDIIDLNVTVYKNSKMFYKTCDFFLIKDKNYILKDCFYYIDMDFISDEELLLLIEHGEICHV